MLALNLKSINNLSMLRYIFENPSVHILNHNIINFEGYMLKKNDQSIGVCAILFIYIN